MLEAWLVRHTCPTARTLGTLYLPNVYPNSRYQPTSHVCEAFSQLIARGRPVAARSAALDVAPLSGWLQTFLYN